MSIFGNQRRQRRKTPAIVSILVICASFLLRWNNKDNVYTRHLNAGYKYYDDRQYGQVVEECSTALDARPNSYRALLLRGTAYAKLNQDRTAIADYSEALSIARTPMDLGAAYYNRGLSYERKGENSKAAADFTECLHQTPGNYSALFERADCYRNTGNAAGAISDVNFYLQRGHSSYYAFYIRGQAYVQQEKWRDSVADFQRELKLKPDDAIGWSALGWSQYMCGDLTNAVESDKSALRLQPNQKMAQFNLALCYAVQNNWSEAKPEYEKSIDGAKPPDLKGALDDIHNALKQSPGSSALVNAQQLVASAKR